MHGYVVPGRLGSPGFSGLGLGPRHSLRGPLQSPCVAGLRVALDSPSTVLSATTLLTTTPTTAHDPPTRFGRFWTLVHLRSPTPGTPAAEDRGAGAARRGLRECGSRHHLGALRGGPLRGGCRLLPLNHESNVNGLSIPGRRPG